MTVIHVLFGVLSGAVAGYLLRAKIGDEITKLGTEIHAKLDALKAKL